MIFFLLLLMASLSISGWYKITRHQIVVMPDGTYRVDGYLFKQFSMFFEQHKGFKAWQYKDDQLEQKYKTLIAAERKFKAKLEVAPEKQSLVLKPDQTLDSNERRYIEDITQARTFVNAEAVFLFLDTPKYVFPKWIRYPLSECPVCMSSVYGSLFWWGFVYFQKNAFSWSAHPTLLHWVMWPVFCVSLSFINYLWAKKDEF